jgi:uroporphyrinogen decarboxylase
MTNRNRVIAAIHHENPDYAPHNVYFTREMLAKMVKHTQNPNYLSTVNNHIEKVSLRKPQLPVEGQREHYSDEFGTIWDKSGADKDIGVVTKPLIKNANDLADYQPPPLDEDFFRSLCKNLIETKGNNFAITSVGFALFEQAWGLCGMEDLLCYMLSEPEAVCNLLKKLAKRSIDKIRIAVGYDIDGIIFGDDWGQQNGLIMGKPLWEKMIKPHVETMYGEVKKSGKYVAQHSCGDLRGIMDDLIANIPTRNL